MSLKELTKDKHAEAENTAFMKAVFAHTLPMDQWVDYTYQKYVWYRAIEQAARDAGLLVNLTGIERAALILDDYHNMMKTQELGKYYLYTETAKNYACYIQNLSDRKQILAHLYTWHMGDMFGGQMIKKLIDAPHTHLEFENARELMTVMRELLTDDMADEVNVAFDWAIKILKEYES